MLQINNANLIAQDSKFNLKDAYLVKLKTQVVPEIETGAGLLDKYEKQMENGGRQFTQAINALENLVEADVIQQTVTEETIEKIIFRPRNAIELVAVSKEESLYYVVDDNVIFRR